MNILFLSPIYSTFIHTQVAKLLQMDDISGKAEFLVRRYAWMRSSNYRSNFQPERLTVRIPDEHSHLLFHPNLPRDLLLHMNARWIASILKKQYRKGDFDLIHAHTLFPAGATAMYLAKKWDIPFVVTTHGSDFYRIRPELNQTRGGRAYDKATARIVEKVLQYSDRIIAVSPGYAEDIHKIVPEAKVEVIPNSYDHTIFYPGDREEARRELGFPDGRTILLSVGHYTRTKGFEYLIEAMPTLVEKYGDIKLYLIGHGELEGNLQAMIDERKLQKHVELHSPVRHDELATWYRAADLYLQPSLNETFGLALAEAQACGLPAVTSTATGPSYILNLSKGGLMVPAEDPKALEQAITRILDDKELYAQIRTAAPGNVKKSLTNLEERIRLLYHKLLLR